MYNPQLGLSMVDAKSMWLKMLLGDVDSQWPSQG